MEKNHSLEYNGQKVLDMYKSKFQNILIGVAIHRFLAFCYTKTIII